MRRGTPKLRIVECDAALQEISSRMPFRYGTASLTRAPLLHVRVKVAGKDGKEAFGFAGDCLPPFWFDRDPAKSYARQIEDQLNGFRAARHAYLECAAIPLAPWEIWQVSHPRTLDECARRGLNPLTAAFGGSFLERAVIDAVCRLKQMSFFEILHGDLLGFDTSRHLRAEPLAEVQCRHTIGLSDPITQGEIPEAERAGDGLPQALEDDIDLYGLTRFKVKVSGEHDRDLERLSRIAVLIHQRCRSGYAVTIDANEQYAGAAGLERLFEAVRSKPYGKELLAALLFIEQPFPRELALKPDAAGEVARLSRHAPVIIDESDDSLDAFERAVSLGYLGVSHKSAKGIFKSFLQHAWIAKENKARKKQKLRLLFQAGEDLACLPVVPLQQDLAALAALGIEHAEKNSHHYFRGLTHLPPAESASAARAHPDLYEEREGAFYLRIQQGAISTKSVSAALGFGHTSEPAFEERVPIDRWSFDRLEALERHA